MKEKRGTGIAVASFVSILVFLAGAIVSVLYLTLPYFHSGGGATWGKYLLYGGLALLAVGIIFIVVCIVLFKQSEKKAERQKDEYLESAIAREQRGERERREPQVNYVPVNETYDLVTVGKYQQVEEKFDQISKMGKTQFVIYVARLFSRKGYQVKLTPVMDNHEVDLLVEKMGVAVAVSCLLSNRVLTRSDLARIRDGRNFYGVYQSVALTNMYFDSSAVQYAQSERISLIDRNVLASEFMD